MAKNFCAHRGCLAIRPPSQRWVGALAGKAGQTQYTFTAPISILSSTLTASTHKPPQVGKALTISAMLAPWVPIRKRSVAGGQRTHRE